MATKQNTKHHQPPKFTGKKKPHKRVLLASNWQYPELMHTILDRAADLEWEIIDERYLHLQDSSTYNPDGLICCQRDLSSRMQPFLQAGKPIAYTWPCMPHVPPEKMPMVMADSSLIGSIAAKHFLERGFKHVCYLLLQDAHHEADGAALQGTRILHIEGFQWRREFANSLHVFLREMPRPLGVVTSGDILGGHLVGFCHANGIAIPEEIAVLTIGNKQPWCDMSPCPLSSIDLDPIARGKATVDLISHMMQGERPPRTPVLIPPARVITRKSTDIIAAADLEVAKALRFLWEHYEQQVTVDDAAREAGLSRSTLERRFRRAIGRSVNEELLRKRLEHCRELLRTTDLSFVAITPRVGFLSKTYLHRIFLKHHGCTPQQYRKTNQQQLA